MYHRSPSGSFTGSMGDVVSGRADFGLLPRDIRSKPPLLHASNVAFTQDTVAGHYVNEVTKQSSKFNLEAFSIFVPSFWFFVEYMSVFLFAFLFAYLLGSFVRTKKNTWLFPARLFYNLFSPENPGFARCSAVGVFFISIVAFLFLVQQVIGNNIKTEASTSNC